MRDGKELGMPRMRIYGSGRGQTCHLPRLRRGRGRAAGAGTGGAGSGCTAGRAGRGEGMDLFHLRLEVRKRGLS